MIWVGSFKSLQIAARIAELQKKRLTKLEYTGQDVLRELEKLGFANMEDPKGPAGVHRFLRAVCPSGRSEKDVRRTARVE